MCAAAEPKNRIEAVHWNKNFSVCHIFTEPNLAFPFLPASPAAAGAQKYFLS